MVSKTQRLAALRARIGPALVDPDMLAGASGPAAETGKGKNAKGIEKTGPAVKAQAETNRIRSKGGRITGCEPDSARRNSSDPVSSVPGAGAGVGFRSGPGSSHGAGLTLFEGGPSLSFGACHEVMAREGADRWAALGFMLALACRVLKVRRGPVIWLRLARCAREQGVPFGPGLARFGFDPGRLVLACADRDQDLLWGLEQAVAVGSVALVLGEMEAAAGRTGEAVCGLTESRRLQLAADRSGVPLLLLRGAGTAPASAARSRWRIAPLSGGSRPGGLEADDGMQSRSGFADPGLMAMTRWQVALERSRSERPGAWEVEWNHEAHHFRLVAPLADRTPDAPGFPARAASPDSQIIPDRSTFSPENRQREQGLRAAGGGGPIPLFPNPV